jgi:hypothetical protein
MRPIDPTARFLPPGFPLPEREAIAALRESVMKETRTPHPPESAELAVLIAADEAGVDLGEVDPAAVWLSPPEAREPLFTAIGRLLGELAEG